MPCNVTPTFAVSSRSFCFPLRLLIRGKFEALHTGDISCLTASAPLLKGIYTGWAKDETVMTSCIEYSAHYFSTQLPWAHETRGRRVRWMQFLWPSNNHFFSGSASLYSNITILHNGKKLLPCNMDLTVYKKSTLVFMIQSCRASNNFSEPSPVCFIFIYSAYDK